MTSDNDAMRALNLFENAIYCGPRPSPLDIRLRDGIETIRTALLKSAQVNGLAKALTDYYVPQLKFSMGGHRAFAIEHADNKEISASHHGAANAFETAIGCIEEALQQFSATEI